MANYRGLRAYRLLSKVTR